MTEENELPNEYQPESLRKKPRKSFYDQIMYAIGEWDEVKKSSGMWAGPTPDLNQVLNEIGRSNQSTIFRFNLDETDDILYSWSMEKKSWGRKHRKLDE